MTDEDQRELGAQLARLQQEHRDLDAAIDALHQSPAPDLLQLQRLKKRKLLLRDRIAFVEDQITPDIIAYRASPAWLPESYGSTAIVSQTSLDFATTQSRDSGL